MKPERAVSELLSQLSGRRADAVLVVPPFAALGRPSISCHLLQACAREREHHVEVLYANAAFAACIGAPIYRAVEASPFTVFAGERIFARAAHRLEDALAPLRGLLGAGARPEETRERVRAFEEWLPALEAAAAAAEPFVAALGDALARLHPAVLGFTTTFQQVNASIAIARRVAAHRDRPLLIFGGAHCEGEMARGLQSLGAPIDCVVSGEAEEVFPAYLDALRRVERPPGPIACGEPCLDLDALPPARYGEYYRQLSAVGLGGAAAVSTLPYETSRGCWWGQKHHCTFCGLGGIMASRQKQPERVLRQLRALLDEHPNRWIEMTDNIMPLSYFRTLLPRVRRELGDVTIFYEQKANLTPERVIALAEAGVRVIQPGIEALSTGLLALMRKGSKARTNVELLRWCRSAGVEVVWNLLYGFPGDRAEHYADVPALMARLHHLQPPSGPFKLTIDRFSPYFEQPERYGIRALRPLAGYAGVFPAHADLAALAYHFEGDYASASLDEPRLIEPIAEQARAWREAWAGGEPPRCELRPAPGGRYFLFDTRGLAGRRRRHLIDERTAHALLGEPSRADSCSRAWALEHDLAVELDGVFVSLVTASPSLLRRFCATPRSAPTSLTARA